jgi:peptide/nickel transport system permease protein
LQRDFVEWVVWGEERLHYLIKRLIQIPVVVLIVVTSGFVLLKAAPGDPAIVFAGEGASPQYLEMVRKTYGLDKPVFEQYFSYIKGIFSGDWGYSLSFERPVLPLILERMPYTLLLALAAFFVAAPLGIVLGIVAAVKRSSYLDASVAGFTTFFNSIPAFILGLFLLYVFAVILKLLPLGGFQTVGTSLNGIGKIFDLLKHLILPSISLVMIWMVGYARVMRNTMVESLLSDYVRAAISRGIVRRQVIFKHAFRNSILSVVTLAGVHVGYMIGGVILTEMIFSWSGIGQLVIQAVNFRDFPLLMGILFFSSIWVGVVNLLVDAVYVKVDPRVRLR